MLLVLGILKWILLIILIIFLLLLFLLLLLLFVPFRYEFFGEKEREEKLPRGRGKISYPGLKLSGSFQEGNLEYKGKFLFLTLFEGSKEENPEKQEEAPEKQEEAPEKQEEAPQNGEGSSKKEEQVDKRKQERREDSAQQVGIKEEEI